MTGKPRGELGGDKNARKFLIYVDMRRSSKRGIPCRGSEPNRSEIAHDCGFDRGVFYQNPTVMGYLADAIKELGFERSAGKPGKRGASAALPNEAKQETEARTRSLEQEIVTLRADLTQTRAELAEARAELTRMEALKRLMAATGRMP